MTKIGYKQSEEHKQKRLKIHIGAKHSLETRKKMSVIAKLTGRGKWMKARPKSEEHKRKLSEAQKGKPRLYKFTEKDRYKISQAKIGSKHWNWKGGITSINNRIRHSIEYRLWREAVFARDNWTCVLCGCRGGELRADHIKMFAFHTELRLAIDNGRTLCFECN